MADATHMPLADLLCFLRRRLLEARDRNDRRGLQALQTTFDLLAEAAYEGRDERVAVFLVDLETSTRDFLTGVGWKSNVPSADAIASAFSSAPLSGCAD